MRSFFICVSALAFLASELIGLAQELSTMALLIRSVIVFAVFFVFGQLFCMYWQKVQAKDDQQSTVVENTQATQQPNSDEVKKEEVSRLAASDPKQTAHIINTLISQ